MNIKLKDIQVPGDNFYISLSKLLGPIEDIHGYISAPYGASDIILSKLLFKDGTSVYFHGEHDCVLLEGHRNSPPNLTEEIIDNLYHQTTDNG